MSSRTRARQAIARDRWYLSASQGLIQGGGGASARVWWFSLAFWCCFFFFCLLILQNIIVQGLDIFYSIPSTVHISMMYKCDKLRIKGDLRVHDLVTNHNIRVQKEQLAALLPVFFFCEKALRSIKESNQRYTAHHKKKKLQRSPWRATQPPSPERVEGAPPLSPLRIFAGKPH